MKISISLEDGATRIELVGATERGTAVGAAKVLRQLIEAEVGVKLAVAGEPDGPVTTNEMYRLLPPTPTEDALHRRMDSIAMNFHEGLNALTERVDLIELGKTSDTNAIGAVCQKLDEMSGTLDAHIAAFNTEKED